MSLTSLQDLPVEVLEMILLKSCTQRVLNVWETTAYKPCGTMYSELATVWSEWWFRITTYWFSLTIKKHLNQMNPLGRYLPAAECVNKVDVVSSVWGLALLNNELYVASISDPLIYVFDKTSCIKKRYLKVKTDRSTRDIAVSATPPCLFVMCVSWYGEFGDRLFVVDPSTAVTLADWPINGTPSNLAVDTSTGNVLVTCSESIQEYTRHGDLVRSIPLTKEMEMSWQAVPLANGDFITCQGWGDTKYHRVCLLSSTGSLVRSRGSCAGNDSTDQFSSPVHTCLDPYGFVVVADSGNNRVCLLSSKLLLPLRDLVSSQQEHDCSEPYRALLDPSSGLLYVGTAYNGLFVFRVRRRSPHWY